MDYELKFMVWPLRLYIANFYISEPVEVVFTDKVINRHEVMEDIGWGNGLEFINNGVPFSFSKELADKFIEWGIARLATQDELYLWTKREI